jgi:hypothetical protein
LLVRLLRLRPLPKLLGRTLLRLLLLPLLLLLWLLLLL